MNVQERFKFEPGPAINWLQERDTNPNDGNGEDTLNQSTESEHDLESEDKSDDVTHLPIEGTQLQMATEETDTVTLADRGQSLRLTELLDAVLHPYWIFG